MCNIDERLWYVFLVQPKYGGMLLLAHARTHAHTHFLAVPGWQPWYIQSYLIYLLLEQVNPGARLSTRHDMVNLVIITK